MQKIKILVIDDNSNNLTTFQTMVQGLFPDAVIYTALSARKGIGLAVKEDPDIIFLDVVMPEMDGFELCIELKKDDRLKLIPVVLNTAFSIDPQMRIKVLEAGAEAFLKKPFDQSELATMIRSMMRIKSANMLALHQKEILAQRVSEQTEKLTNELERRKQAEIIQTEVQAKLKKSQISLLNILEDLKAQNIARLESEKALKESHEKLRDLAAHIQEVREEERKEIALNLHDDLWQKLTALNIDLAWLAARIPTDFPEVSDKLISMQGLLMETVTGVKQISSKLRPSILDDLGIGAAIIWQTNEFSNRTDVPCKVSIIPEDMTMPDEIGTQVFRIVQEAFTNIMRHSEASNVVLSLIANESKWRLRIKDNGEGFSEEDIVDKQSFGLTGMEERARLCGGTFTIKGAPGKGTEIVVEIPISGQ